MKSVKPHRSDPSRRGSISDVEPSWLNQRLWQFAEYAPIHFGITDPNHGGTFLEWNQVSERMFGYTREEAIGKLCARDLHASEAEFQQVLQDVDQGSFDGECVFLRKDGTTFPGRLRVVPVLDEDGHIVERCGFIEDLTETHQMMSALEKQRQHRHHEDRIYQMGRLSGVIAHDINNVLSVILCTAQMVAEDLGPDHACTEDLHAIEQAVDSAAGLMRKLLVFTGRQVTVPQSVDVSSWIEEQARFFTRILHSGTQLKVTNQSRSRIWIDPNDLQQVLVNLLINGDKAIQDGGTLSLHIRDVDGRVELTVADTGVGIPAALLGQIFQPFFTTREDGTGLGLSTARGIIERASGTLQLTSTEGVGTQVRISLPMHTDATIEEGTVGTASVAGALLSGQVLVVEDQEEVRRPLVRALRSMGFQVQEAGSLVEAQMRLHRLERLRLLLTDSKLVDGYGSQLLPLVRQRFPRARSVLISGLLAAHVNADVRAGFDAQLAKPFSLDTLRQTLCELLASPPKQQSGQQSGKRRQLTDAESR